MEATVENKATKLEAAPLNIILEGSF